MSAVKKPMEELIRSVRNRGIIRPFISSVVGFAILFVTWDRGDSKAVTALFCLGACLLILGLVLTANGYGCYKEVLSYQNCFPGKEWDAEFYLEWKKGSAL